LWIISPVADILLLTATPLAIVPLIYTTQLWFSPEVIALWVFALASLGHHLPGFLRAYGDLELFRRFRWQFLLAPVAAVSLSLVVFVGFESHSLELLLLLWATWHIMMQTYGFMRIYDAKRGRTSSRDSWLDFAACAAVFTSGIVFSNARVAGIAETLLLTGFPVIPPQVLTAAQWVTGIATAGILLAFFVRETFSNRGSMNWPKLLLMISTALLYWASGSVSVNLLIGVAMFEIFHAVQYFAIVWFFNRNRATRSRSSFGPLAAMFSNNTIGLLMYVAAIAAFGVLGFVGRGAYPGTVTKVATALFAASAMLHFYYDGFIWKVRDKHTAGHLNIAGRTVSSHPLLRHAVLWCGLSGVLLIAAANERSQPAGDVAGDHELDALLALAPDLPELQLRASQRELIRNNKTKALQLAENAANRRPRWFLAQLNLAEAAVAARQWDTAAAAYAAALRLRPANVEANFGVGVCSVQQHEYALAKTQLARCIALDPQHNMAEFQLGNAFYLMGEPEAAIVHYQRCIELKFNSPEAHSNLGAVLFESGDASGAASAYRRLVILKPADAAARYNLGRVLLEQGRLGQAKQSILEARRLGYTVEPHIAAELQLPPS